MTNERIREQMSALMDGELPRAEAELLLRRIAQDPALAAHWSRLHLIRDALQGELPTSVRPDLAAQVRAAVAKETPALQAARGRWARPLAGLALAASVAGLAFIGIQQLGGSQPARTPVVAEAPPAGDPAGRQVARAGTRWDRPEAATRLNGYLVNHNEYAAGAPMQGMMSYVRIVAYDTER